MQIQDLSQLVDNVIQQNNPNFLVYLFQMLAYSTPTPNILPQIKKILLSLNGLLSKLQVRQIGLFLELGIDILIQGATHLQQCHKDFSVILLDCLSLTDCDKSQQIQQFQQHAIISFKQQALHRLLKCMKWHCLNPTTLSLVFNYLFTRFKIYQNQLTVNVVQLFVKLSSNPWQYIIQSLIYRIIDSLSNPNLSLILVMVKTAMMTQQLGQVNKMINLIQNILISHKEQIKKQLSQKKGWINNPQKDIKYVFISFIRTYLQFYQKEQVYTNDLIIQKMLSLLFQFYRLRQQYLPNKWYQFAQAIHLIKISQKPIGGQTISFLISFAIQSVDTYGLQISQLALVAAKKWINKNNQVQIKKISTVILSAQKQMASLFIVKQFCQICQKILQAKETTLTIRLSEIYIQMISKYNPGRGYAISKIQNLLRPYFYNPPTFNLIITLLKTCQKILAEQLLTQNGSWYVIQVIQYLIKHKIVMGWSHKAVKFKQGGVFLPYGLCLGLLVVSLPYITDKQLQLISNYISKDDILNEHKNKLKSMFERSRIQKFVISKCQFKIQYVQQLIIGQILNRIYKSKQKQIQLQLIKNIPSILYKSLISLLKTAGISRELTQPPLISQNSFQQIKQFKQSLIYSNRYTKQSSQSKLKLQTIRRQIKTTIRNLNQMHFYSQLDKQLKQILYNQQQLKFMLNSLVNYRMNIFLFQYRINSRQLWTMPEPDTSLQHKITQILSKSKIIAQQITAEHFQQQHNLLTTAKLLRRQKYKRWKQVKKRYSARMAQLIDVPRYYKLSRLQSINGMHLFSQIDLKFDSSRFQQYSKKLIQNPIIKQQLRVMMRAKTDTLLPTDNIRRMYLSRLYAKQKKQWQFQLDCQYICRTRVIFGKLKIGPQLIKFKSRLIQDRTQGWLWTVDRSLWSQRQKQISLRIDMIQRLFIHRVSYKYSAIELYTYEVKGYLFNFLYQQKANAIIKYIKSLKKGPKIVVQRPKQQFKKSGFTQAWLKGQITNYDYLMKLNIYSGRSFNDLSQYPVMPWVIADYQSQENPHSIRDLSKPIGALSDMKLNRCLNKLKDRRDMPKQYYNLYDSFFSAPTIVKNYLIRIQPFLSLHYQLQGKKIDVADRLFHSMKEQYNSCIKNQGDFKQIIPQFYTYPHMLKNLNGLDLGTKQSGVKVKQVQIPPWSRSQQQFISSMRVILQKSKITQKLHQWIDLIFGYKASKQNGQKFNNLFQMHTYQHDFLSECQGIQQRKCLITRLSQFGQFPIQLFNQPHPQIQSKRRPLNFDGIIKLNQSQALDIGNLQSSEVMILSKSGQLFKVDPIIKKDTLVQIPNDNWIEIKCSEQTCLLRKKQKIRIVQNKNSRQYAFRQEVLDVCDGFIVTGDQRGSICTFKLCQLQLQKLWQIRQNESIHYLLFKNRIIFAITGKKLVLYSLMGKYLGGIQIQFKGKLLSFDAMQSGYILLLDQQGFLTIMSFDCNILAKSKLVLQVNQRSTSAIFFNQFLPKILISTNKGRIILIKFFALVKSYAKGQQQFFINTRKQIQFIKKEDKEIKKMIIMRASQKILYNILWIDKNDEIYVLFEEKRMKQLIKHQYKLGPLGSIVIR